MNTGGEYQSHLRHDLPIIELIDIGHKTYMHPVEDQG